MSSSKNDGPPGKIGDCIRFFEVAKVLERVCKEKRVPEKNKIVVKFIEKCRNYFKHIHNDSLDSDKADGDSLFSVIRILLPKLDRERTSYGFQAKLLGRILSKILGLNDQDTLKLTKFRDPDKSGDDSLGGDFASVLFSILQARFSDTPPSNVSLTGLHNILDMISRDGETNQATQKSVLLELFTVRKLSPLEGKWLCRILLKNLEYGVNRNVIFKAIHPQAYAMYERISNLKKVCETLNDPDIAIDIGDIVMFYYVKPMLCLRTNTLDDFDNGNNYGPVRASSSRQKSIRMSPPFVVETKWDGERFQIHYDGRVLKYISKQGHDFTNNFNLSLTPGFTPLIKSDVKSFILDGEMMAWNKRHNFFTQKGEQIDVKRLLPGNQNHCPTYVAFDVLFYNDETMINKPFQERYKILKRILKPKEGLVVIPEPKIVETKEQIEELLNKAIDDLEEGLVVKAIDSVYEPGKRTGSWRKIKPEFIFGTSVDDLDLLILGAYYSDSTRRKGTIGNFLVGLIQKSGNNEEFYALTQVGSGQLKLPEMKALIDELKPYLQKKEFPSVNYKAKQRPDLYIDPKKSIVVQVKASEIKYSDTSAVNYNLRFPRITKVRKDKNYHEVMTVNEFHTLRESCGGKLARRTDNKKQLAIKRTAAADADTADQNTSDEDEPLTKRSLGNSSTTVATKPKQKLPPPPPLKTLASIMKTDLFKSHVFCVYGTSTWKTKIEQEITMHGGVIVQNPVNDLFVIVGETPTYIKVAKAIPTGKWDIIKPAWISKCIQDGVELPFTPSDFYCFTKKMGQLFELNYDQYGDSYTQKITSLAEVKELIAKTMKQLDLDRDSDDDSAEDESMDTIHKEVDAELFPKKKKKKNIRTDQYGFFKGVRVAFRGETDIILASMVEFYGGGVASDETEDEPCIITHVIVKDPLSPSKKKQLSAFLVKPEWITDCVRKRACLDELPYSAKCLV